MVIVFFTVLKLCMCPQQHVFGFCLLLNSVDSKTVLFFLSPLGPHSLWGVVVRVDAPISLLVKCTPHLLIHSPVGGREDYLHLGVTVNSPSWTFLHVCLCISRVYFWDEIAEFSRIPVSNFWWHTNSLTRQECWLRPSLAEKSSQVYYSFHLGNRTSTLASRWGTLDRLQICAPT